jgi:hypothetical protein
MSRSFRRDYAERRQATRDACLTGRWDEAFDWLAYDLFGAINGVCGDDVSWRTPLHMFVEGGASKKEISRLIAAGALLSVRDRRALRPADVVPEGSDVELIAMLEPVLSRWGPADALDRLQSHLRRLIDERAGYLVREHRVRIPQLAVLLESREPQIWCPIPQMYGGFRLRLKRAGLDPLLESSSSCRIVCGSGQRHEITVDGIALVESGY